MTKFLIRYKGPSESILVGAYEGNTEDEAFETMKRTRAKIGNNLEIGAMDFALGPNGVMPHITKFSFEKVDG